MDKTAILFHKNNRKRLLSQFNKGLVLIAPNEEVIRNGDVNYQYRQDSDFLYFTGITRPNHLLLMDAKTKKSHLFIPDIDEKHRLWIGRQLKKNKAKKVYGVNCAHYLSAFNRIFTRLSKKQRLLYTLPSAKSFLKKYKLTIKTDLSSLRDHIDQLRLFKQVYEIACIKNACKITHDGYLAAVKATKPGCIEWEIQAALENEFTRNGAFYLGFDSIIASGQNASILHYVNNDATLKKGDLLLIDAGCEWNGYCADFTRAFPISGRFSTKQKQIYQIVLDAQKACLKSIKPGVYTPDLHKMTAKLLMNGLMKLGIIKKGFNLDLLYEKEIHRVFFPHGTGHLLGLDVHDVGSLKKHNVKNLRVVITLKPGMVFTVEPGIYFIEAIFDSPRKRKQLSKYINWKKADAYRSVGGIRIEDNILITKTGHVNLTKLPKEIKDVEKLMRK